MSDLVGSDPTNTLTPSEEWDAEGPARPRLIVLLECGAPLASSSWHALDDGGSVVIGRGRQRTVAREGRSLALRFADKRMSGQHAALSMQSRRWVISDSGSKNGMRVNGVAAEQHVLADGDLVELGQTFLLYRDTPLRGSGDDRTSSEPAKGDLVSFAPTTDGVHEVIRNVAASRVSVLLSGETGVGKEVYARALHRLSGRRGAFVAVNCGALPEGLVEAELFGAVKGAYTGIAENRQGLVRAADGGTLFLDEIGDMPLPSQAAMLRVIQEGVVVPVGQTDPVAVDMRILAATHRNLDEMVAAGTFRADLLARLSGLIVELPPLRERRDDLGILIATLIRARSDDAHDVQFTTSAARAMLTYDWPSNVRELEKCLESAIVLAAGEPIAPRHLPKALAARDSTAPPRLQLSAAEEKHRDELIALFTEHKGNVSSVARALGKARMQLHRWTKRYGIEPADYR